MGPALAVGPLIAFNPLVHSTRGGRIERAQDFTSLGGENTNNLTTEICLSLAHYRPSRQAVDGVPGLCGRAGGRYSLVG